MDDDEVVWPTGMSEWAVRALADHQVLHFRHYGHGSQDDLHMG
jgi:hypothetical protein